MKFRKWLWSLDLWQQITSVPLAQRAIMVALALGGRAQEVAEWIPAGLLSEPRGLATLVFCLEQRFGTEDQDDQKLALEKWDKLVRPRGQNLTHFLNDFDQVLTEASFYGLRVSDVGLSQALISKARLGEDDIRWILLPAGGDFAQYQVIRRAFKRLPRAHGKDVHLTNASGMANATTPFPVHEPVEHEAPPIDQNDQAASSVDPVQASVDCEQFAVGYDPDQFELDTEANSSDDQRQLEEFAAYKKFQKKSRKGQGKSKKASPPGAQPKGPGPPPGVSVEQWNKRVPCPKCGSRWHRDCSQWKDKPKAQSKGSKFAFLSTWCGLEPDEYQDRKRLAFEATRERFGIVVDTGSEDSLLGEDWGEIFRQRVLRPRGLDHKIELTDSDAKFRGISGQSQSSDTRASVPVGIKGMSSMFEAQVLPAPIPPLMGLARLFELHSFFDLTSRDDPILTQIPSPTPEQRAALHSAIHRIFPDAIDHHLDLVHGHLVIPCDDFSNDCKSGAPPRAMRQYMQTTCRATRVTNPGLPDSVLNPLYELAGEAAASLRNLRSESRAFKRYAGLPADTPPPDITPLMTGPMFDILEFGPSARISHCAEKHVKLRGRKLCVGPLINWDSGWDLNIASHRKALDQVMDARGVRCCVFSPDSAVWNGSAVTSAGGDPSVKSQWQDYQSQGLHWLVRRCRTQSKLHRNFVIENPRGSALLKLGIVSSLLSINGVDDTPIDMCMHGLTDSTGRYSCQRPTVLRSNMHFKRSAIQCSQAHAHRHLTYRGLKGRVACTWMFAKRIALDIVDNLKTQKGQPSQAGVELKQSNTSEKTFESPVETCESPNETFASSPEASTPLVSPPGLQMTGARGNPTLEETNIQSPFETLPAQSLQEFLCEDGEAPEVFPTHVGGSSGSGPGPHRPEAKAEPKARARAYDPADRVPLPPEAVRGTAHDDQGRFDNMDSDSHDFMCDATKDLHARIDIGSHKILHYGNRIYNYCLENFTNPQRMLLLLTVIFHSPKRLTETHYLHSDVNTRRMVLVRANPDSQWKRTGRKRLHDLDDDTRFRQFKDGQRPKWVICLFARPRVDADPPNPLKEMEDLLRLETGDDASLPGILATLVTGSKDDKVAMLLQLHRRLYHKSPDQMTPVLRRAGVPLATLSLIKVAVGHCEICKRWSRVATQPSVATRLASAFNQVVYGDILFLGDQMFLILLDDATRFCKFWYLARKDFVHLERAIRRCWISEYGPPHTLITDKERALALDTFGVWCDSRGIKRELVTSQTDHLKLGALNRKSRTFREAAPRLLDALRAEDIEVEPEDLAAELTICANTEVSYGGRTPYECLYGTLPHDILLDTDHAPIAMQSEALLPFFPMQIVRCRARQAHAEALLQSRLTKALHDRPRTQHVDDFKISDEVDFWISPVRKDVSGWRGPATVVEILPDGQITVKWQGTFRDVPLRNVRPHITLVGVVDKQVLNVLDLDDHDREPLISDRASETLMVMTERLSPGAVVVHYEKWNGETHEFSPDAHRDDHHVFELGRKASIRLGVHAYRGVCLSKGPQNLAPMPDAKWQHVVMWPCAKRKAYQVRVLNGAWPITCSKLVGDDNWISYCFMVVYEGQKRGFEETPLQRFLKEAEREPHVPSRSHPSPAPIAREPVIHVRGDGRRELRDPNTLQEPPNPPFVPPASSIEVNPTEIPPTMPFGPPEPSAEEVHGRPWSPYEDDPEQEPDRLPEDIPVGSHPGSNSELLPPVIDWGADLELLPPVPSDFSGMATRQVQQFHMPNEYDESEHVSQFEFCNISDEEDFVFTVKHARQSSSVAEGFSVVRENRELSSEEVVQFEHEVWEAKLKEINSWTETKSGWPTEFTNFVQESGVRPIPWRWVLTWKQDQQNQWIIKARLVLKGFAERHADKMETYSPTADRASHMYVCLFAAFRGEYVESMDVGAAFLRGWSFGELKSETRIDRKPCAFIPNDELWLLFGTSNPEISQAVVSLENPVMQLDKGAYGLKDAVLLWNLALFSLLCGKLKWHRSIQDPLRCVYIEKGQIIAMLSVHVDDLLIAGPPYVRDRLHKELESRFGPIKRASGLFRHFGIHIDSTVSSRIVLSQEKYIEGLHPVEIHKARGDGRLAADCLTPKEVTDYRSLTCGIAWVGLTCPWALGAASLYQSWLPEPTIDHARRLNTFLDQLRESYVPIKLEHEFFKSSWHLLAISDSSFANRPGKYPQGAYVILAMHDNAKNSLDSNSLIVGFGSRKSRRVAKSSQAAETLALVTAVEKGSRLQELLYEFTHILRHPRDLAEVPHNQFIPLDVAIDADDVYATLIQPAIGSQEDSTLAIYIAALRHDIASGRVRHKYWIPTDVMPANELTKLEADGTSPLNLLPTIMKENRFRCTLDYKCNTNMVRSGHAK